MIRTLQDPSMLRLLTSFQNPLKQRFILHYVFDLEVRIR